MASQKSTFVTSGSSQAKVTRRIKVTKTIQRTLPDGKVETETVTEYKEVSDDANADFGGPLTTTTTSTTSSTNEGAPPMLTSFGRPSRPRTKEGSSSSDSGSGSDEEKAGKFAETALNLHNDYRKQHGVEALKLSEKLCKYAQEWADKLAREEKFEHRPDTSYGENLFCSWSSDPKAKLSGQDPVKSWYSEVSKHTSFSEEPRSMGTGHFTQVVWKASRELGIAKARAKSGKWIVVANYDPPGNVLGKYVQNVGPPRK